MGVEQIDRREGFAQLALHAAVDLDAGGVECEQNGARRRLERGRDDGHEGCPLTDGLHDRVAECLTRMTDDAASDGEPEWHVRFNSDPPRRGDRRLRELDALAPNDLACGGVAVVRGVQEDRRIRRWIAASSYAAGGGMVEQRLDVRLAGRREDPRRQRGRGTDPQLGAVDGTQRPDAELTCPLRLLPEARVEGRAGWAACTGGCPGPADDDDARSVRDRRPQGANGIVDDDRVPVADAESPFEEVDVLRPVRAGEAERRRRDRPEVCVGIRDSGARHAFDHLDCLVGWNSVNVAASETPRGADDRAVSTGHEPDRLRVAAVDPEEEPIGHQAIAAGNATFPGHAWRSARSVTPEDLRR